MMIVIPITFACGHTLDLMYGAEEFAATDQHNAKYNGLRCGACRNKDAIQPLEYVKETKSDKT